MALDAPPKVILQRGTDMFLVCIAQVHVSNLKRLFQVRTQTEANFSGNNVVITCNYSV